MLTRQVYQEILKIHRELRTLCMRTAREHRGGAIDYTRDFVANAREHNRMVVTARQRLRALQAASQ